MSNRFCVFIISHGRADNIVTLSTLAKGNYSGPLFIVCDNEDKTLTAYQKKFGSKLLVFNKKAYADKVDSCDNFQNRRTTTHARNACFDFAEQLGFEFFLVLDDDYVDFRYTFDGNGAFVKKRIKNLNNVFSAFVNFLDIDERIQSVCLLQGGDIFGGENCTNFKRKIFPFQKRKAMNSFFCKTDRRFWFFSRLNEDVNTYLALGNRGLLFFTIPDAYLQQTQTQANAGGMSDAYIASGTYVKTFYTIMNCPSFAVATVTASMKRIHHKIRWNNAVPKIIDDAFRKK